MSEQPVNLDAADVDIEAWNAAHPGGPVEVEADPDPADVLDLNQEPGA